MKIEYAGLYRPHSASGKFPLELAILSVVLAAAVILPTAAGAGLIPCVFKSLAGVPCPGCGMTRAFLLIGHGHLAEALRMNPNSLLAFGLAVIIWLNLLSGFLSGRRLAARMSTKEKIIIYSLAGAAVCAAGIYNVFFNKWA